MLSSRCTVVAWISLITCLKICSAGNEVTLSEEQFLNASHGIISNEDAKLVWAQMLTTSKVTSESSFTFINVLYYLGALLIMGSMSFFMTLGWRSPKFIFIVSSAYQAGLFLVARIVWQRPGLRIPGGLLFTAAVSITQLVIYGLQQCLGVGRLHGNYGDFHVYVRDSFVWMELSTMLVGAITLRWVDFPFLLAPIAFSMWYLSMDIVPFLFKNRHHWDIRRQVSQAMGIFMTIIAFQLDRKAPDLGFWMYLFGVSMFWMATSATPGGTEFGKFLYCMMNLGFLFVSVLLDRAVFAVFGSLGITMYLSHLAHRIFKNSMLFPFVLSAIGLAVMYCGYLLHVHGQQVRYLMGL